MDTVEIHAHFSRLDTAPPHFIFLRRGGSLPLTLAVSCRDTVCHRDLALFGSLLYGCSWQPH